MNCFLFLTSLLSLMKSKSSDKKRRGKIVFSPGRDTKFKDGRFRRESHEEKSRPVAYVGVKLALVTNTGMILCLFGMFSLSLLSAWWGRHS